MIAAYLVVLLELNHWVGVSDNGTYHHWISPIGHITVAKTKDAEYWAIYRKGRAKPLFVAAARRGR